MTPKHTKNRNTYTPAQWWNQITYKPRHGVATLTYNPATAELEQPHQKQLTP